MPEANDEEEYEEAPKLREPESNSCSMKANRTSVEVENQGRGGRSKGNCIRESFIAES